jgi:hypothetical protein
VNKIYVVNTPFSQARLVEAPSKSKAIAHCRLAFTYTAKVASQQELVMMLEDGVKVEQAGQAVWQGAPVKETEND